MISHVNITTIVFLLHTITTVAFLCLFAFLCCFFLLLLQLHFIAFLCLLLLLLLHFLAFLMFLLFYYYILLHFYVCYYYYYCIFLHFQCFYYFTIAFSCIFNVFTIQLLFLWGELLRSIKKFLNNKICKIKFLNNNKSNE